MAIRKKMATEEDRRFWSLALSVSKEVETWPEWKRGGTGQAGPTVTKKGEGKPSSDTCMK